MLCAISNAVPADPVVSVKTGHVFERTLIEKYIADTGKCPMSGQELSKDDLLPLKMGKPIKPRHTPAMSIPGILGMLHNEYDAVMLEAYELRDALRKARKELAESLYQHDAACRVIARLQGEKEAAEKALEGLQMQVAQMRQQAAVAVASAAAGEGPPAEGPQSKRARPDDEQDGLSTADLEEMEAKRQQLSAERKHRDPNLPGLAAADDLDSLAQALAQPLHSPSQAGVLSLALQPSSGPQEEATLVATGGSDHSVQVLDVAAGVIVATLTGHAKKVTALTFAGPDILVSGGADGAVRAWHRDQGAGKWLQKFSHMVPDTVVDVCGHPVSRFVVALSSSGAWVMLDVSTGRAAITAQDPDLPGYTCGAMHPDGNFFAAGGTSGGVRLFDTRKAAAPLAKIDGVEGAVRGISFNENGYWAAVACDGGVQIWDLRKVSLAATLQPFDTPASTISWDFSGKFLACGGPASVKVYEVIYKGKKKGMEPHVVKTILDLPPKAVNAVKFGALARSLYIGASDHNLRIFKC